MLLITSNNRRTRRSLICNGIIWFFALIWANPILITSNYRRTRGSSIWNGIIWFCALLHRTAKCIAANFISILSFAIMFLSNIQIEDSRYFTFFGWRYSFSPIIRTKYFFSPIFRMKYFSLSTFRWNYSRSPYVSQVNIWTGRFTFAGKLCRRMYKQEHERN